MEALGYLPIWCQEEEQLLEQTYWTARIVGEIHSNVSEACAIAFELGYV